ncbi:MAG TPA: DUF3332 domain-containing protein [Tenuifilaceae bacterium]|jgi:hypothetical protein|nr:DUF3332 domain-containing protein [Tenuifilaceae bacterium]
MKKTTMFISIFLVMIMGAVQSSCIGSFKLSKKVLTWNKSLGGKFLNELVYILFWVLPVYEVSMLIDGLILNTIEFWTGSNPVAMNPGEVESKIVEQNGVRYQVVASQNRFDFTQLDGPQKGQSGALVYSPTTKTWSYEGETLSVELLRLNDDGTTSVLLPEGATVAVDATLGLTASLRSFAGVEVL